MSLINEIIANLSVSLRPYIQLVPQTATYLGLFQIISPALTLNGIRKEKNGTKIPIIPFLFVAIFTMLNVLYSQIRNDEALYNSNLVGFTLGVVYLTAYMYYTPSSKRNENLIAIASGCAFIAFVFAYTKYENPAKIEQRFENLLTSVLWSYHFIAVIGVLKAFYGKNSAHLPLEMILVGALMGVNRIFYGIFTRNTFIVIQYLIFVSINFTQLFCILIFPREEKKEKVKKEKKEKKTKLLSKSKKE